MVLRGLYGSHLTLLVGLLLALIPLPTVKSDSDSDTKSSNSSQSTCSHNKSSCPPKMPGNVVFVSPENVCFTCEIVLSLVRKELFLLENGYFDIYRGL